jgi:hypothetical protein
MKSRHGGYQSLSEPELQSWIACAGSNLGTWVDGTPLRADADAENETCVLRGRIKALRFNKNDIHSVDVKKADGTVLLGLSPAVLRKWRRADDDDEQHLRGSELSRWCQVAKAHRDTWVNGTMGFGSVLTRSMVADYGSSSPSLVEVTGVRPGAMDCSSLPQPHDPAAAVAAVLAEGGDVVSEQKVRTAGLGHLITKIKIDHQAFARDCALHSIGNALRSSEAAIAQLDQQVTGGCGYVPSIAALAARLCSAGQGRTTQLVHARNIVGSSMSNNEKAALLDGTSGGRLRLDYVGVAHIDWDARIDNCFGLLCTSEEHVFLIKKDLLFDNTSTLPHALRLTGDPETNRLLFASLGIEEIGEFRGLRNGRACKRKGRGRGRGKGKGKGAKRARHC